jgi:hypothetical protein
MRPDDSGGIDARRSDCRRSRPPGYSEDGEPERRILTEGRNEALICWQFWRASPHRSSICCETHLTCTWHSPCWATIFLSQNCGRFNRRYNSLRAIGAIPALTRLGFDLTRILKRIRPSGVSAHLHYCWAYRGEVIIKTNNHSTKGPWTAFEAGSGYGRSPDAQPTLNLAADGVALELLQHPAR